MKYLISNCVHKFRRRSEEANNRNPGDPNPLLEGEIFEMLFTLTDFVKFKELFVDYRHVKLQLKLKIHLNFAQLVSK